MSTADLDRATVSAYAQAVAILLKLGSPLFRKATENAVELNHFYLHHWVTLRLVANTFLDNRSRALAPSLKARLLGALKACRELENPVLDLEHRVCDVGSLLDQLSIVLTAEAGAEVPVA